MRKSKILLSSILTIALCVSLIAGATLAMFTSESKVNISVTSGNIEVAATIDKDALKAYTIDEGTGEKQQNGGRDGKVEFPITNGVATFVENESGKGSLKIDGFVPGNSLEFDIQVTNSGSMDAKYQMIIGPADEASKLSEVLVFDVKENDKKLAITKSATGISYSEWRDFASGQKATLHVAIEFPMTATDDYSDDTSNIDFVVKAVQHNAKTTNPVADEYGIHNYSDFVAFRNAVKGGTSFAGKTVSLMSNIDLSNPVSRVAYSTIESEANWEAIGDEAHPFDGTFNGNGFTISNLKVKGAKAALFGVTRNATIKDIVIDTAEVIADNSENSSAGVLVAEAMGSLSVRNVTVEDCVAKREGEGNSNVGVLVGTMKDDGATNASLVVENVNITANENEGELDTSNSSDLVGGGDVEIEYNGDNELELVIGEGFVEKKTISEGQSKPEVRYEISSANGLGIFRDTVNAGNNYKGQNIYLTEDIDLKNNEWTPIGGKDRTFNGTFNGQHFTIKNLLVVRMAESTIENIGLFGYINDSALVQNLVVENADISYNGGTEAMYVGVIGRAFRSDIKNITLKGKVNIKGNQYIGGIVGACYGNIEDCHVIASENSLITNTWQYVGGIVGHEGEGKYYIKDCSSNIDILVTSDGWSGAGGIAGCSQYGNNIENCTIDDITITIGRRFTGDDEDANGIGAIVGRGECYKKNGVVTIKDCKGTCHIVTNGGAYYNYDGLCGMPKGKRSEWTTVGGDKEAEAPVLEGNNVTVYWDGISNREDFEIATKDQLFEFASLVAKGFDFNYSTAKLTDNIDLVGEKWIPVGNEIYSFKGIFDGNEKTIDNLTVDLTKENNLKYAGMFGVTENCEIKDLTLTNVTVNNRYTASLKNGEPSLDARNGALIGIAHGNATIENVIIKSGTVISPKTAAGFIGEAKNSGLIGAKVILTGCENHADICSPKATGFVSQIENAQLFLTNCVNYGNISMPQEESDVTHKDDNRDVVMGGFIGYCMGRGDVSNGTKDGAVLINCVNYGNIEATINYRVTKCNVGGIVSSVHGGKFILVDVINRGNITVTQNCTDADMTRKGEIGGIIGSTGADMYHVEQYGNITVNSSNDHEEFSVGGFVGDEDSELLHMYGRSVYTDVPKAEDGTERNILSCVIKVNVSVDVSKVYVGAATGRTTSGKNSISASDLDVYISINGKVNYPDGTNLEGMTGNATEYTITDTTFRGRYLEEGGFDKCVTWN